ncbi:MAG: hypothetical protein AAFX45_10880 [Pseudomonadota bacterium]
MRLIDLTDLPSPMRKGAHHMLQQMRAVPVWGQVARAQTGSGPQVAFLPSKGRTQSSLLRIYNVADGLRALGWRTLVVPWTLTLPQRRAALSRFDPDLVVVQGARHALNRPHLYARWPIVYDMDDADFHIAHLAEPVAQAMPQVAAVIAGSSYIADWCRTAGAPAASVVWTGTPVSTAPRPPQKMRPPVVAWAQTRPDAYAREAQLVRQVMARVADVHPGARLRLYDRQSQQDPAFLDSFKAPGLDVEWRARMSYEEYLASFDDVAVSLAPLCPETLFSRGKSFGKVLAALDRKVPVVGSDVCEHGAFFQPDTGIITNKVDHWVSSIADLLARPDRRQQMADKAFDAFVGQLTVEAAAKRTSAILHDVKSRALQRIPA